MMNRRCEDCGMVVLTEPPVDHEDYLAYWWNHYSNEDSPCYDAEFTNECKSMIGPWKTLT